MTNVNYDVELLNSVVSSGSISYESTGKLSHSGCSDGCAGNCEDRCGGCGSDCSNDCTGSCLGGNYD